LRTRPPRRRPRVPGTTTSRSSLLRPSLLRRASVPRSAAFLFQRKSASGRPLSRACSGTITSLQGPASILRRTKMTLTGVKFDPPEVRRRSFETRIPPFLGRSTSVQGPESTLLRYEDDPRKDQPCPGKCDLDSRIPEYFDDRRPSSARRTLRAHPYADRPIADRLTRPVRCPLHIRLKNKSLNIGDTAGVHSVPT
jgi:hypothetical protein